jgi:hypothetical protein
MHYLPRAAIPGLLLSILASCASVATRSVPSFEPYATVTRTEARFVFPFDSTPSYTWNVPGPRAVAGAPLFSWNVAWETPETTAASDYPYGLVLIVRWKPGGERAGPLAELITSDPLQTKSSCHCSGPVYLAKPDPGLIASVEEGHLVFSIRGSDAVRRILPIVPDSVEFSYHLGRTDVHRTAAVIRRNR